MRALRDRKLALKAAVRHNPSSASQKVATHMSRALQSEPCVTAKCFSNEPCTQTSRASQSEPCVTESSHSNKSQSEPCVTENRHSNEPCIAIRASRQRRLPLKQGVRHNPSPRALRHRNLPLKRAVRRNPNPASQKIVIQMGRAS